MTREQKDRILERNRYRAGLRSRFQRELGRGTHLYQVYYIKEPRYMDMDNTKVFNRKDYQFLLCLEADNLEQVFQYLQGEIWSPRGEARELMRELGLNHTSMSVGDLIQNQWWDYSTGEWKEKWYMVNFIGFTEVKEDKEGQTRESFLEIAKRNLSRAYQR